MVLISLGIAALTFVVGFVIRTFQWNGSGVYKFGLELNLKIPQNINKLKL